MKTTIILGNGFDLDMGWKTSFQAFYWEKRKDYKGWDSLNHIKKTS